MRVTKIEINPFKQSERNRLFLTNVLKFNDKKNQFDERKYNLSLILGENGTRKTTVLQLIYDLFNNEKNKGTRFRTFDYSISLLKDKEMYTVSSNDVKKHDTYCRYLTTSILNKVSNDIVSNTDFVEYTSRKLVNLLLSDDFLTKALELIDYPVTQLFEKNKVFVELIGYKPLILDTLHKDTIVKIESIDSKKIEDLIIKTVQLNDYLGRDYLSKEIDNSDNFNVINNAIYIINRYITVTSVKTNRYEYRKNYSAILFNGFAILDPILKLLDSFKINEIYKMSVRRRIGNLRYVREVWFSNEKSEFIPITQLSSGELSFLAHLLDLNECKEYNDGIILIDEPELHLHPKWIASYISLLDIFFKHNQSHIIVATHSPLLANKVFEEDLILLKKVDGITNQIEINRNPLGMRIDDLLNDIFHLNENDKFLEIYKNTLIKKIKHENERTNAINEYESLEESLIKFEIFKECYLEITESRGS